MWLFKRKTKEEPVKEEPVVYFGVVKYHCYSCGSDFYRAETSLHPIENETECNVFLGGNRYCEGPMKFECWCPGGCLEAAAGPWKEPKFMAKEEIKLEHLEKLELNSAAHNRHSYVISMLLRELEIMYREFKNTPGGMKKFYDIKRDAESWIQN